MVIRTSSTSAWLYFKIHLAKAFTFQSSILKKCKYLIGGWLCLPTMRYLWKFKIFRIMFVWISPHVIHYYTICLYNITLRWSLILACKNCLHFKIKSKILVSLYGVNIRCMMMFMVYIHYTYRHYKRKAKLFTKNNSFQLHGAQVAMTSHRVDFETNSKTIL